MMKMIQITIVAFVVLASACGGGNMEWKGTLKGMSELVDYRDATSSAYPRPAPLDTGPATAELTLAFNHMLTLGPGAPLPGCMLNFFSGQAKRDNTQRAIAMDFKITEADRAKRKGTESPCVGVIDKGAQPVLIEIDHAEVSLKDDGEFFVTVNYRPDGDYTTRRVMYLQGKRGWF